MVSKLSKSQRLGRIAYDAILKQDANTLKELITNGLDINDIDLSGTPVAKKYGESLSAGKVSALNICYNIPGSQRLAKLQKNIRPEFIRSLGEMGTDFNQKFAPYSDTSSLPCSPLEIICQNFLSSIQNDPNMLLYSEGESTHEILNIFLENGAKADKCYTASILDWVTSIYHTYKTPKDEIKLKFFKVLYRLERAGDIDIYQPGVMEYSPEWLSYYHNHSGGMESPVPQITQEDCLDYCIRRFTPEEDKAIIERVIDAERQLSIVFIRDVFEKMCNECNNIQVTDPIGPDSYYDLLKRLISTQWKKVSMSSYVSIAESISSRYDWPTTNPEFNDNYDEKYNKATSKLWDLLLCYGGKEFFNHLLCKKDRSNIHAYSNYEEVYSSFAFSYKLFSKLCRAAVTAENVNVHFDLVLRDAVAIMSFRPDEPQVFERNMSELSLKMDLIKSIGWDANQRDERGETQLHRMFSSVKAPPSISYCSFNPKRKKLDEAFWEKVFRFFSEKGVDFSVKNDKGETPADMLLMPDGTIRHGYQLAYRAMRKYERGVGPVQKTQDEEHEFGFEMSW